jgi:hypothetical protein
MQVWQPIGVDVNEHRQLFEMCAQLPVDHIDCELVEQSGNEDACRRHTNRDPDGSANDQTRSKASEN